MKKFLFFILAICPLFAFGQKATEAQKQEALAAATKLCSLLSQYSNGGITYLSNDQKIFNLCSTPKISTFDDISAQKEVFLNLYLALITKKYKNHLKMTFSVPVIKESYAIPSIETVNNFVTGTDASDVGYVNTTWEKNGFADIYIIMEVKQNIPLLKKETIRQIIFSIEEGKIISFSNRTSPFVSYAKAIDAYIKKKYSESIVYCDKAIKAERFDYKKDCALIAILNCVQKEDFNRIYNYTKYLGDLQEYFEWLLRYSEAEKRNDLKGQFECLYKITSLNVSNKGDNQAILAHMYACGTGCEKSQQNALYYYDCAVKNGSTIAGYYMFLEKESGNIDIDDVVIIPALKQSASKGYISAYYQLAKLCAKEGKTEEEGEWHKKGAEQGDLMGMIYYGYWLAAIKHDKQSALYWLEKAVSNPNLSAYLDNRKWKVEGLTTVEDIKLLVYKVENDIPLVTAPTSSSSTTTSSTSASYNRYNQTTHRGFNMPFNEHGFLGFSVGYVQKQWVAKEDGETTKMGFWDDTKYMSGIQAGVRVEPLLKYGFGIDTGLYYEYYYSKSKSMSYEGTEYEPSIEEHSLYLPLHLEYRLNYSSKFQMFFYGGIGLDYVLSAKVKTNNEDLTYDEDDAYENANLKKFNTSLEYGGGIRVYGIQLNFTLTDGLLNINKDSDANVKQHKSLMCSLSYMF